jgi:hypothetical protein
VQYLVSSYISKLNLRSHDFSKSFRFANVLYVEMY